MSIYGEKDLKNGVAEKAAWCKYFFLINIFIYNFYLVSMAQLGVDSRMERELNTNIMDFTITVVIRSLLHHESIRKYMNLTRQKITAKDNGEDEHDSHSLNIVMV